MKVGDTPNNSSSVIDPVTASSNYWDIHVNNFLTPPEVSVNARHELFVGGALSVSGSAPGFNEYFLITVVVDQDELTADQALKLFINGVQQPPFSIDAIEFSGNFEDIQLQVGCTQGTGGSGVMKMKDLLVFIGVAHDDATRQSFEAMLAAKEGISI